MTFIIGDEPPPLTPQQRLEMKQKQIEAHKEYNKKLNAPRHQPDVTVNVFDLESKWKLQMSDILRRKDKKLIVDEENREFYEILLYYFSGHKNFEKCKIVNQPSLKKGLLIFGAFGFGKSLAMLAMQQCRVPGNTFAYSSAHQVTEYYDNNGNLGEFVKGQRYFDDFGTEEVGSNYGKKQEVFRVLLEQRYDLFQSSGLKTHLTTNITPEQILERYGARIESRIYEMFNLIFVNGKDRRRM